MNDPHAEVTENLHRYWKDDFGPLHAAGKSVTRALREDDSKGDLYHRLASSGSSSSSNQGNLYFDASLSVPTTSRWRHVESEPLPLVVSQALQSVRKQLLFGLLAAARLSWASVDDSLYIWSIRGSGQNTFSCFRVPSHETIVSVGLIKPKKGAFGGKLRCTIVLLGLTTHYICYFSCRSLY